MIQLKTKDNMDIMINLLKNNNRKDAVKKYSDLKKCDDSTAYDMYLRVTRGYPSKRQTNNKKRYHLKQNNKAGCFFCGNKIIEEHHLDYLENITIKLCLGCHKKLHSLILFYHKANIQKDEKLINIKAIIENSNTAPNLIDYVPLIDEKDINIKSHAIK